MPKIIVSFSGGKDSTWMLLEMIRRKEHIDEVVFFDTGWEFPQMLRHIEKIKKLLEDNGITFTTLYPKHSFDYLMFDKPVKEHKGGSHNGYSWCGLKGCRWGTTEKILVINSYFETEPDHIQCVGIAVDEVERLEKERKGNKRFPLAEYGITEAECLQGCYSLGYDWEGLYEDLDRVSCKFCALKNLKELRNVYWKMPDVWSELKDYQSRTYMPYKGEGKSVFDLEVRFELEKEFEAQGKSIRNREFFNELKKRLRDFRGGNMIIAVDFDGTLAVTDYPKIIRPIKEVIHFCRVAKAEGDTLILWTCRHGKELEEAVEWCKEQGLTFDYINENPPEKIPIYGDSRKVYADIYLDDHNLRIGDI